MAWVEVTAAEAEAHPLHGMGGWLRLFSALTVLSVVGGAALGWQEWIGPDQAAMDRIGGLAIIANVLLIVVVGAQLLLAVLWFRQWPGFRRLYAAYAIFAAILMPLAAGLMEEAGLPGDPGAHGLDGDLVATMLINAAFYFAMYSYFHRSRRFRVTFEQRVRA